MRRKRRLLTGAEAWTWALTAAVLAAGSVYPRPHAGLILDVLDSLTTLLPVVAAASLIAGALATGTWSDRAIRMIEGSTARAVLVASVAGTVTPVCGLGILPLIAALLRRGVPLAPVMAFWVSSPVMGPSMVVVTVGVLGVEFALAKTLAALGTGLLAGTATALLPGPGRPDYRVMRDDGYAADECAAGGFWREAWASARMVLRWLTLALVLEIMLQRLVPESWVQAMFGAGNAASVLFAAVVGAPLYVDGYAALPLVRGLMDMGMSFGAALAFMVSGAAVSVYAAVAVAAIVRLPVFVLYVALAVTGAVAAGFAAEWIMVAS